MKLTPDTPLKWSAIAFGVFWTVAMLWWTGSSEPVEICILTLCGALGGFGWYLAMAFVFRRIGLLSSNN